MIFERDIEIGDKTVTVKLYRPTAERFATLAPDTRARFYCLIAKATCDGVTHPDFSVTIPRAVFGGAGAQAALDSGMMEAAQAAALLAGAHTDIMRRPQA